jgi:hypothetical protein
MLLRLVLVLSLSHWHGPSPPGGLCDWQNASGGEPNCQCDSATVTLAAPAVMVCDSEFWCEGRRRRRRTRMARSTGCNFQLTFAMVVNENKKLLPDRSKAIATAAKY